MRELIDRLANEFTDREYAHAYMEDHLVTRLAAQIYALRKQRGWSQQELSEKSGVAQERISKIESADFESLTMKTLQKFSKAFDINLHVSFEEFSKGILDVVNLSASRLDALSREEDLLRLQRRAVKVDHRGAWCALEKDHLSIVKTHTSRLPVTTPTTQMNQWQELAIAR